MGETVVTEMATAPDTPTPCGGHVGASGKVRHHVANSRDWPWFPTEGHGHLAKHPYCRACGKVAAVGGQRALDAGGIANLLSRLEARFHQHGLRLTEAHKRLVMRRLHEVAADDPFGVRRETQMHALARVLSPFVGVPTETVEVYVRSC